MLSPSLSAVEVVFGVVFVVDEDGVGVGVGVGAGVGVGVGGFATHAPFVRVYPLLHAVQ